MELTKEEKLKESVDSVANCDTCFVIARKNQEGSEDTGTSTIFIKGTERSLVLMMADALKRCPTELNIARHALSIVSRIEQEELGVGGSGGIDAENLELMVKRLRMADNAVVVFSHGTEDGDGTNAGGLMVFGEHDKLVQSLTEAMDRDDKAASIFAEACARYMAKKVGK